MQNPAMVMVQTQAQLDLLRFLPADGSKIRLYTQAEWDSANESGRQQINTRIEAAESLVQRGLVFHYLEHALTERGQRLVSEKLPAKLPKLTAAEAQRMIADASDWGSLANPIGSSGDPWADPDEGSEDRGWERGYESGADAALNWARDVLARVKPGK